MSGHGLSGSDGDYTADPDLRSNLAEFTDDLMTNTWTTGGVSETGATLIDDDFESVTNRVLIDGTTNGFVRLKVEIND